MEVGYIGRRRGHHKGAITATWRLSGILFRVQKMDRGHVLKLKFSRQARVVHLVSGHYPHEAVMHLVLHAAGGMRMVLMLGLSWYIQSNDVEISRWYSSPGGCRASCSARRKMKFAKVMWVVELKPRRESAYHHWTAIVHFVQQGKGQGRNLQNVQPSDKMNHINRKAVTCSVLRCVRRAGF